jgi:hypothetical protein
MHRLLTAALALGFAACQSASAREPASNDAGAPVLGTAAIALSASNSPRSPQASASPQPTASAQVAPTPSPVCKSVERAAPGDTWANLARRCYGSRTYDGWLSALNHPKGGALRAGEDISIPSFSKLAEAGLSDAWKRELPAIEKAHDLFFGVQAEIESALRGQSGGRGAYNPSPRAKQALTDAADALSPVVDHLKAAKVRNHQLADALTQLRSLASGSGSVSLDYETETIHQHFMYGLDALRP